MAAQRNAIPVARNAAGDAPYGAIRLLDQMSGGQTAHECRCELQPIDGEGHLQPFRQTGRGIRVVGREPLGLLSQSRHALLSRPLAGCVHHALDLRGHRLR